MKCILCRIIFNGNKHVNLKDENGQILQKEEYQVKRQKENLRRPPPPPKKNPRHWDEKTKLDIDFDCTEMSRSVTGIKTSVRKPKNKKQYG